MNNMNPKVDWYFDKAGQWQAATEQMRNIVLDCGLIEELKWGCPCYTFQGRNIVLIHVFKEYCAYLFFKGALMQDPENIMIQQTENVQSARQVRFTDVKQVVKQQAVLKKYIYEAVAVEEAGLQVPLKKTKEYVVPEEFQTKLDELPALKEAFEALTPGRQRGYLFYFNQAKQSKTRTSRVEKYIPQILAGRGLED
jgi:uncharacterized protein YdeI (YjbR/CyaY-like superfamily)